MLKNVLEDINKNYDEKRGWFFVNNQPAGLCFKITAGRMYWDYAFENWMHTRDLWFSYLEVFNKLLDINKEWT